MLMRNFLQPPEKSYTARKQNFQRMLKTRNRSHLDVNSSNEKSFDSFDTITTEGAQSSESSRVDVTTSFESSTTNDSDSKLHTFPSTCTTTLGLAFDSLNIETLSETPTAYALKTAARKRQDFQNCHRRPQGNSWQSVEYSTTDSNCASSQPFDGNPANSKRLKQGVFFKLLNANFSRSKSRENKRDYSIDEKTDAVFREFMRYDPVLDQKQDSPQNHRSSFDFISS